MCSSPNIRIIKSRIMRVTYHVTRIGQIRNVYWLLVKTWMEEATWKMQILLKRILKRWGESMWTGFNWLRDHSWVFMNTITNIRFPEKGGYFLTNWMPKFTRWSFLHEVRTLFNLGRKKLHIPFRLSTESLYYTVLNIPSDYWNVVKKKGLQLNASTWA